MQALVIVINYPNTKGITKKLMEMVSELIYLLGERDVRYYQPNYRYAA